MGFKLIESVQIKVRPVPKRWLNTKHSMSFTKTEDR